MIQHLKDYPKISEIEELIDTIWCDKIREDIETKRILYYEHTLVAAFYHHLRPFVDNYSGIRMFLDFYDPKLGYRYDLVIVRKNQGASWKEINPWERENCFYWFVIEFKFVGKMKNDVAQDDIRKLRELKNIDNKVKRAYFFLIEDRTDYSRFINYHGNWYERYYREGRGLPIDTDKRNQKWNFTIDYY